MLGMTRRLTDVLAAAADGKIYRIERFICDPNAATPGGRGTAQFEPALDCTCRTSSGDPVTWLGGRDYRLIKTGAALTAMDRRTR